MVVLRNLRLAIRDMFGTALDIARELYPDDWRRLTPRLLSLASWVGYDTDGRSDILWTTTYAKRLRVQLDQLRHYRAAVDKLLDTARTESALAPLLELLEARLDLAIKSGEDDLELFGSPPPHDREWTRRLAKTSREMAVQRGIRLTDAHQLQDLVERALGVVQDDAIAREPASCAPSWRARVWPPPPATCGSTPSSCTTPSARRSTWTMRRTIRRID